MHQGVFRPGRFLALSLCLAAALFALTGHLSAAETIPPKPTRYFNDYALTVKPETAERLNKMLEDQEKQTSNQILVAIYPSMQTDSDVASYCLRIFRAWQVGQKDKNNGVVLFVFVQNHKMWIQTGRGIEGALPDATAKDITADIIAPRFKVNDYDGGLTAGVDAIIAATKGEYKGTGTTQYQREHPAGRESSGGGGLGLGTIFFLIIAFIFLSSIFNRRRGGRPGGTMFGGGPPIFLPGGFGGGFGGGGDSGGFGGGGGSSDGGGSFSSGGGDTGGGGAGSDW